MSDSGRTENLSKAIEKEMEARLKLAEAKIYLLNALIADKSKGNTLLLARAYSAITYGAAYQETKDISL